MKIIVTGDKGFLGSRLVKRLRGNHDVVGLNRTVGDISDFKVVYDFVAVHRPDLVIHSAAIGDIGRCEENKEMAYKSNVVASVNLATACADHGSRFIYISSDQVYDAFTNKPINELTPTNPNNYYGRLKVTAEEAVRTMVPNSHICRIGWQFDWYNPENDDSRGGMLAQIGKAIATHTPLYFHPQAYQYICYVEDTIDALMQMIEMKLPYGTYNVTQKTEKPLKEVFEFAMRSLGVEEQLIQELILPKEAGRTHHLCAEPFHMEMCGYLMPSCEEGIFRCIERNRASL